MALLSFDEEMARARPVIPFAFGYEFDHWSSIWCNECRHQATCPLLLVSLRELTPGPWEDVNPQALNRYHCHEFEATDVEVPQVQADDAA